MLIKAKWVLDPKGIVIENVVLEIHENRVIGVRKSRISDKSFDLGSGVVTTGLVNCHSHLWLSHFRFDPSSYENFLDWTKAVIEYSDKFQKSQALSALETGIKQAKTFKTYGILDIQPLWLVDISLNFNPEIRLLRYVELLGRNLDQLNDDLFIRKIDGICFHGVHTVPVEIFSKILTKFKGVMPPITIHVAESEYEMEFLRTGKGAWHELSTKRGFDTSKFEPFGKTPCQRLLDYEMLNPRTILAHCLHLTEQDAQLISQKGASICVCPRSNLNLHKRLPPLNLFLKYGINLCLGTDSLASVDNLSLWDDVKCLLENFPHIDPKFIFKMATTNGAFALGLGQYSIENSFLRRLIYVETSVDAKDLYASLIYGFEPQLSTWIGDINGI